MVNSWPGGLQATVVVTNNGPAAISSWTVRLTLPSGQAISNLWNGINSGTTGSVTVSNVSYNGAVAAGGSTTFGYTTTGASTSAPSGISCTS